MPKPTKPLDTPIAGDAGAPVATLDPGTVVIPDAEIPAMPAPMPMASAAPPAPPIAVPKPTRSDDSDRAGARPVTNIPIPGTATKRSGGQFSVWEMKIRNIYRTDERRLCVRMNSDLNDVMASLIKGQIPGGGEGDVIVEGSVIELPFNSEQGRDNCLKAFGTYRATLPLNVGAADRPPMEAAGLAALRPGEVIPE